MLGNSEVEIKFEARSLAGNLKMIQGLGPACAVHLLYLPYLPCHARTIHIAVYIVINTIIIIVTTNKAEEYVLGVN